MKNEKLTLAPWAKNKTQKEVWDQIEKRRARAAQLEARDQLLDTIGAIEANIEMATSALDRIANDRPNSNKHWNVDEAKQKVARIHALVGKLK